MRSMRVQGLSLVYLLSAGGCWSPEDCDPLPGSTPSSTANLTDPSCSAVVVIGLYPDDQCASGTEVLTVTLHTAEPCAGWSRSTGTGAQYNSASHFQCFQDRLCYTQYVESCACDAENAAHVEAKESHTTCLKDPTPGIWTRIISGTEACPEPPSGYECPRSDSGQGNTQVLAACGG
jgi:hypothetical protein